MSVLNVGIKRSESNCIYNTAKNVGILKDFKERFLIIKFSSPFWFRNYFGIYFESVQSIINSLQKPSCVTL
jgi:hypothetical protein